MFHQKFTYWIMGAFALSFFALSACYGSGDPLLNHQGGDEEIATTSLTYSLASSGQNISSQMVIKGKSIDISKPSSWTQDSVRKSAALVNFIEGLKLALAAYHGPLILHCDDELKNAQITCDVDAAKSLDLSCDDYIAQLSETKRLTCLASADVVPDAQAGAAAIFVVEDFIKQEEVVLGVDTFKVEKDLAASIKVNMAQAGTPPPYNTAGWGNGPGTASPTGTADASAGESLGATPGGAQDIGYLRTTIEQGFVPLPTHLAVEGFFSEHDLPIEESQPCQQLLCVRSATGYAPVIGQKNTRHFVQVGFSTNLQVDSFKRNDLNLAVVLDVSGSMSGSASDTLSKMEAVKLALTKMVDKLTPNDRLSIVLFNTQPTVLLSSTAVTDKQALKDLIATIEEGGGTNIESGLQKGYDLVEAASQPQLRSDRVFLLTDALPNSGRTGENSFLTMAEKYAAKDIGLSSFGVGINFGQELVLELSQVKGGNYFFLEDADRIDEVFTLDFDYMVTPLAYDMQLSFVPSTGYKLVAVHGISSWQEGQDAVEMIVPTLFLSRNHGAIVIELEATQGISL